MSNDELLGELGRDMVICMTCALARNGLTNYTPDVVNLWTPFPVLDGLDLGILRYYYNPDIDYEYELTRSTVNTHLLLPSLERGIIEYMKCKRWCDEGVLIEALQDYLRVFCDMPKLYRAADHFDVSRSTVDYWIREAQEESSMSMG